MLTPRGPELPLRYRGASDYRFASETEFGGPNTPSTSSAFMSTSLKRLIRFIFGIGVLTFALGVLAFALSLAASGGVSRETFYHRSFLMSDGIN